MDSFEREDAGAGGSSPGHAPARGSLPENLPRQPSQTSQTPQSEPTAGPVSPSGPEPRLQPAAGPLPAPVPLGRAGEQVRHGDGGDGGTRDRGIAGLSLPYQVAAALSLALIGALACVHLGMVFLHVAPSNTVTKQHGEAVDWWVYPEFEQNWKLFAPNPLQQNVAVQVRAEYTAADGGRRSTDWIDLSAEDGAAIQGSLLPSHVHQNMLRRAWDFYVTSHDGDNRPNGVRGQLSERYVRRIAMARLMERDLGGPVERIQLRSATSAVDPPEWSDEKIDAKPVYRVLPWWTITAADLPENADPDRAGAER
ncbi:DUF5819 family protein [Streptomyces sp. PR69]|uniref:DUF5819 family protein n=1 Tax=Streptomyces sp. PR69 TaxID=2984950 RepID=UPI0022644785|nr:DUF5819 family protein [Streptomyces sp. PR69]